MCHNNFLGCFALLCQAGVDAGPIRGRSEGEGGDEGANDVAALTFNAAVDLLFDAGDESSRQSKETGAVSLLEECRRILGDETPSCCKVAAK